MTIKADNISNRTHYPELIEYAGLLVFSDLLEDTIYKLVLVEVLVVVLFGEDFIRVIVVLFIGAVTGKSPIIIFLNTEVDKREVVSQENAVYAVS